jgi:hypothetical protein
MDAVTTTRANLTRSTTGNTLDVIASHHINNIGHGGQSQMTTTPPSPLTDTSSAPTLSHSATSAGTTPNTDLTSLPSDVSKLSLGPAKKPPLGEGPAVTWPYSQSVALDDIPGIAFALDTFLKSFMVESEEYCHRVDPRKCVASLFSRLLPATEAAGTSLLGNVCTLRQDSA